MFDPLASQMPPFVQDRNPGLEPTLERLEVAGKKIAAEHVSREHRAVITLLSPLVLQTAETLRIDIDFAE